MSTGAFIVVFLLGGARTLSGVLSVGGLVAFYTLATRLYRPDLPPDRRQHRPADRPGLAGADLRVAGLAAGGRRARRRHRPRADRRRDPDRGRDADLARRHPRPGRRGPVHRPRPGGGLRRPLGGRQIDAGRLAQPLHRSAPGFCHRGRPRRAPLEAGQTARRRRPGPPGNAAVPRHAGRQPAPGPASSLRRGTARRPEGGRTGRIPEIAARGTGNHRRRARHAALRRRAAAAGPGPRAAQGPGDPRAGRGDLGPGPADRAAGAGALTSRRSAGGR